MLGESDSSSVSGAAAPDYIWPSSDASRVPFAVYTDPAIFAAEQERVFRGPVWHYLGLEAEVPRPGDFVATYVGTTPVILNRARDGHVAAFVNRCAHRGALVTRERRGNCASHVCIYHQWSYNHDGALTGVPYRRGIEGVGGFPADFDPARHGLRQLKLAQHCGIVFGSLSDSPPSLEAFFGQAILDRLARQFNRPIQVLGYQRQRIRGNWKLIVENVKDAYHGALLHAFNSRFGNFRSTQRGDVTLSPNGLHSILTTYGMEGEKDGSEAMAEIKTYRPRLALEDRTMLRYVDEQRDGIVTSIMSVFPSFLLLHGRNRPVFRHVLPKSVDEFEMVWTYFGYTDDDAEMRDLRLRQANFLGPGGYVSVEDSEAIELVQRAIAGEGGRGEGVVALGGRGTEPQDHLVTEVAIRGFWRGYRELMGFAAA
jgi:phenylpropionate dioxygenase-like ring-hydroxylating dioxygenase large terminal subunit